MNPISYLFIDAANFRIMMKDLVRDYGSDIEPAINWQAVGSPHRKIFYYDALPPHRRSQSQSEFDAETEAKRLEFERIELLPRFHAKCGVTRHRKGRPEQKMVDILLAVDALSMGYRGLFDSVSIVTSDLDFEPLLRELVNLGVQVTLLHPRMEINRELVVAADAASAIDIEFVRSHGWLHLEPCGIEIPVVSPVPENDPWPTAAQIEEGWDEEHGQWQIHKGLSAGYVLEVERGPRTQQGWRTRLSSSSLKSLVHYARDHLNLQTENLKLMDGYLKARSKPKSEAAGK